MYFLGLGLLFLTGKYLEISPIVNWSWTWVLSPFGAAVLWCWSGYTIKVQEKKMEIRKQARINKNKEALGMPLSSRNKSSGSKKTTKR
jgi:small Trp-rich protein